MTVTVDDVIRNLENTIAGKRTLLADMNYYTGGQSNIIAEQFIHINIAELVRILADLRIAANK